MGPSVSVVIASRDRDASLRAVVSALVAQLCDADELIVVDDSAEGAGSYEWLSSGAQVLRSRGRGPAAARNLGWMSAGGEVVAFTDDDVHIGAGWLEAVRSQFGGRAELMAVEGRTVTPPFDRLYEYSVSSDSARVGLTCNVAYRRTALERVGGFDEHFPFAHCEDFDLFVRVQALGTVGFCEGMIVEHEPRAIAVAAFARRGGWLRSERRLYTKHRELRPYDLPPAACAMIDYLRWPVDALFRSGAARPRDGRRRLGRALLISALWWGNVLRASISLGLGTR